MKDTVIINTFPVHSCMICGAEGELKYSNLNDRNFGNTKNWNISKCTNSMCELMWLNPMPTKLDIGKAYESYYTHVEQKKSLLNISFIEKAYLSIKYNYYPTLSSLQKLFGYLVYVLPIIKNKFDFSILYLPAVKNGKVLDFGCGNGWTLNNLKKVGWDCYGLDFDNKAVEYCKSQGLKVNLGDIQSQNYPDEFFDAITINHVIEHVHEVDDLLLNCYKKLKKGGKLVIATPNTENWQHYFYKQYWFQLDPPRHLHLFNIKNLESIVSRNNFNVLKSFSSIRMDAWSTIVTRGIKKTGRFVIGKDNKSTWDLLVGIYHQCLSYVYTKFNKRAGGEIVLIATKK